MTRVAAAAVVLAIVAAAVIWIRHPRADGRSESHARPERVKTDPEAMPAFAPTRALASDEAPATNPAPASFTDIVSSGLASVVSSAPNGIEFHVVDRDTGEPVASALVAALDVEVLFRRHIRRDRILERLPVVARDLVLARTDEHGVAFLPRTMQQGLVWAEAPGRFGGSGMLGGTSKPVTIAIGPPCSLRVIVVDVEGRPLPGVEVAIGSTTEVTTAPDGLAFFRHLELTPDLQRRGESMLVARVALRVPNSNSPTAEVDLKYALTEPVRLVAPRGGRFALRLVDRDGHAAARRAPAELTRNDPGDQDEQPFEFTFDEKGEALLQCVETWHRFRLTVKPLECDESVLDVLGPIASEEATAVDVPIGAPHFVLVGRFVDGSGHPPTGTSARGQVETIGRDGTAVVRKVSVRLDNEAAFRLDWTESREDGDVSPTSVRWCIESRQHLDSKLVPVPPLPASGVVDLGAIVVETAPLIARGVVVNETGAPVPRAVIVARYAKDGEMPSFRSRASCDEAGRFELRGLDHKEDLSIAAITADGEKSDAIPLAGVDDELRVVVARFGSVCGRLRPASGFTLPLRLTLSEPLHGARESFDARAAAPDGSFRFEDVPPGRYSFEISVQSESAKGETLLTIPDVAVNSASVTDDPRMLDLAPWEGARFVEITALESDGTPASDAEGILVDEDGFDSGAAVQAADGIVRIPTKWQRVSVAIRAAGRRPAVVSDVTDHATITLSPMLVVHVVVAPLPENVKRGTVEEIEFSRRPLDRRFPWRWQVFSRALRGQREVDISVPIPGTFGVRLQVDHGDQMLESVDARPVTILDLNESQRVEVVPMPKAQGR